MTFFTNTNIFTYFYLVLYLQLIRSEGAYKIQPARGTACILSRLCPIFIMVCSTFYFSALQVVVLHCLELLFTSQSTFTFIFFYLVLYLQLVGFSEAQKLLSARGTVCIFNRLRPIFITVCFEFYFSAFHLVLHYIRIIFFS